MNVAIAAEVTTGARLKLYSYLDELGESVLYSDNDAVIYVHKVDPLPKVKTGFCFGISLMN